MFVMFGNNIPLYGNLTALMFSLMSQNCHWHHIIVSSVLWDNSTSLSLSADKSISEISEVQHWCWVMKSGSVQTSQVLPQQTGKNISLWSCFVHGGDIFKWLVFCQLSKSQRYKKKTVIWKILTFEKLESVTSHHTRLVERYRDRQTKLQPKQLKLRWKYFNMSKTVLCHSTWKFDSPKLHKALLSTVLGCRQKA